MCSFKYKFDVSLDSAERTLAHRRILASKPFLRKIYLEWYKAFIQHSQKYSSDKMLDVRDKKLFESRFPGFEIESISFHNSFLYIASGGFSYHSLAPVFLFPPLKTLDKILCRLSSRFAMFMTVTIKKVV